MAAKSRSGWKEADRLAALDSYAILDTPPEENFDDIVQLVCQLTDAPIAAVNLIADRRQWFKSEIGLGVRETPLDDSICKLALLQDDSLIIPDTLTDPRTNCNLLVTGEPGLRFYAGALLKTPDGLPLGTLCVLDTKPRPDGLTSQQNFALKTLARQVMTLIEMHKVVCSQKTALIEKERLEAETYAGRERFQQLVDQAATGIVETDSNGCITLVNKKFCDMLGYSESELVGRTVGEITHSASLTKTQWVIGSLASGSASQIIEKQYRRKDGSLMWATSSVNALRSKDGQFQGMVANIVDITERKRSESALQDAQARLEANLTAGEVSTWIYDIQANRMFADRNLAKLFGVSEEHVDGGPLEPYLSAIHSDDREEVRALIQESIQTGKPYQARYRVRDEAGDWRFVFARGKIEHDESGLPIRMPGVVLDVTQQKLIEEELQAKEERYGALFNAIDEGFCIIDMVNDAAGNPVDYRFLEANPAFEKHSGLSGAVGKTARELVPNLEHRWIDLYGAVASTGKPVRLIDQSSQMGRWFDVHASKLGGDESRKVAILFNDITEQKQNEEHLRKLAGDLAESNRRKTEFLATLAHELRNPLAPIRTGLDLLEAGRDTPATVARVRDMMGRQVDHMTHLVNDLLDIARINSGKVELRKSCVELAAIVSSAIESTMPSIKAKHHELLVALPDHALWLDADITRLTQVLGNLLSNAAKYTPAHGTIALTVRQENHEAVISIADSGIGIPGEALPDVFEMFTQVGRNMPHAQGGLGIGLSLVRRLVELHGGTVKATSAGLGQGSEFIVRLPLRENGASRRAPSGVSENDPGTSEERRLRILVVDDNQDAADSLADLLGMLGHQIMVSNGGVEALQVAKRFHPDMVMLDLGMPGMSGHDVARAMRKLPETQRSVLAAITGWGAPEDRALTREAGFDHHLTKPVDMKILKKLLHSVPGTLLD